MAGHEQTRTEVCERRTEIILGLHFISGREREPDVLFGIERYVVVIVQSRFW